MTAAAEPIPVILHRQRVSSLTAAALIFILAAICFGFRLGTAPLAGTEGHRAITAQEMLRSGDYLLPHLYGHLYLMKPPLAYWLIAASERLFGPGEWVWRLPSFLSSVLLAAGICAITSKWFDAIAGFAAGIAFIAIIPLWSQERSADVDAINHLGGVIAALLILDIALTQSRPSVWAILLATFAAAVSFLSKFPAGIPIMVGALLAPALVDRHRRLLRRWSIYLPILLGLVPLAIWFLLALRIVRGAFLDPEISGAVEASQRLVLNLHHVLGALSLPVLVLVYGLPVSALLALPFLRNARNSFDNSRRRLITALAASVLIALAIQVLTGMINPRYAFLDLPLLCPLAGAAVYMFLHAEKPPFVPWGILTVLTLIYCGIGTVFILLARHIGYHSDIVPIIATMGLIAILAFIASVSGQKKLTLILAVLGVCAASTVFGIYKSSEETLRSAKSQSAALAAAVPKDAPVWTWNVLWSQPELFYYAHLHPTVRHPLADAHLPSGTWLVLDDDEWAAWKAKPDYFSHLSHVKALHPYKHIAYICWYSR